MTTGGSAELVAVVLVGVLVTLSDLSMPHRLNRLLLLVLSLVSGAAGGEVVVGALRSSRLAELDASLRNLSSDFLSTTTAAAFDAALGDVLPPAAAA